MGIEESYLRLKNDVIEIGNVVCQNRDTLVRIENMLKDIIQQPNDKQDKEKRIKDSMVEKCVACGKLIPESPIIFTMLNEADKEYCQECFSKKMKLS